MSRLIVEVYDMKKGKFEWKILLRKAGVNLLYAVITGLIVMWQDDPKYVAVIVALKAGHNWVKHNWM